MLRCLLALALALGLLSPGATFAKPPDLPLQIEDQLEPLLAVISVPLPEPMVETPAPTPALPALPAFHLPAVAGRVSLAVRKQIAACLLFSVHPLMPLVPTDKALDLPCDHPMPPLAFDRIGIDFAQGNVLLPAEMLEQLKLRPGQEMPPSYERIGVDFSGPAPVLRFEVVVENRVCFCQEVPVACAPRPPATGIEKWTPGSVLENLTKLIEANGWLACGESLLAAGRLAEAMECFDQVIACVPGSPLAAQAQAAIQRVFARIYRQPGGTTEEAEPKPMPEPIRCPIQCPRNNMPKECPRQTGGEPGGLSNLEVPVVPLVLRIEEQSADKVTGGEEESDEPLWFLPWLDEWNVPANVI
jgi:hypothetical protein